MVAISHMWLVNTWNIANETEELTFYIPAVINLNFLLKLTYNITLVSSVQHCDLTFIYITNWSPQ